MKKAFHGYYGLADGETEALVKEGIIVLDANVLLNIYRYSLSAREALFAVLTKVTARLWIPHQFALEFHKNRIKVISSQAKKCDDTINSLESISKELTSSRTHALVDEKLLKSIKKICIELKKSVVKHEGLLAYDEHLTKISSLFDGKVGAAPSAEELAGLETTAGVRFSKKIPPGYEDVKNKTGSAAFGDYIGWAQILEHSKGEQKDVLFVSDERKGDWWIEKQRGKAIGPRSELIEEFQQVTKKRFYMYSPDVFLEIASRHLDIDINPDDLKEVRNQSLQENDLAKGIKTETSIHAPKQYATVCASSDVLDDPEMIEKSPPDKAIVEKAKSSDNGDGGA